MIIVLPILTPLICGIEPVYRISQGQNDGFTGERLVEGNGLRLIWAPRGPGWPDDGMDWHSADRICKRLSSDGLEVMDTLVNVWRLPTRDEVVRSMYRNGELCEGYLNEQQEPVYNVKPDKETPLWNPNSKVIYWWTADQIDAENAWMIVYDGKIWARRKNFGPNSLGFRAVRSPVVNTPE